MKSQGKVETQDQADQGTAEQAPPVSPVVQAEEHARLMPMPGMCPVVGIGASAGGLEAFTRLLASLPVNTGMAFVLVQHLDPANQSMLADLLSSHTSMTVRQAVQDIKIEPNHVYVIPPNRQLIVEKGVLKLSARSEERRPHLPIDLFFGSLANDQGSRAIGVVLSGSASDGTIGLEAIKAAGGITFAQDDSAAFDSMPRNAIAAGVVDFVMPPDAIAREIATIAEHFHFADQSQRDSRIEEGPALQRILTLLQSRRGVDFTHYKMPTVYRRLSRRMALNHLEEVDKYLEVLEGKPEELDVLFDDLLITVSEFFRDSETFDVLAAKAFPQILADRSPDDTIRVWVSGCASGKEVYSLAICLIEYLEEVKQTFPVQIFGTDVSDRAIEAARTGKYPESIAAVISPERLKRFFVKVEDGYQIARSVRELCIFSRQDVTKDPPLSKMDLISCRNLLIYLGPTLQRRVLSLFSFALQRNGCLLLGSSESLGASADNFTVLDGKHKIYMRNPQIGRPEFDMPPRPAHSANGREQAGTKSDAATLLDRKADAALLDEYAPSGFLVNSNEIVVKFRGEVGPYLAPAAGDPQLGVFQLVREDIAFPLRAAYEEARTTNVQVRHEQIRIGEADAAREINLVVRPMGERGAGQHYLILFEELWKQPKLPVLRKETPELPATSDEYQKLVVELAATRAYMQRLVEELRSANEEAQSSNEELQSTNEELQTAKEELQSSNEELTTTNEEMQSRNGELSQVNNDLVNLLSSLDVPIVMLDSDLRIRRYTPVAEKVLNLIPTDIGRPISDLNTRIKVADLEQLLANVVTSVEPMSREVQDQYSRWYSMRIHPYRTVTNRVEGAVLQLLDIDQLKRSVEELKHARDYSEAIVETVREPLLVLNSALQIQMANRAFLDTFGLRLEEIAGRNLFELDNGQWSLPGILGLFERLAVEGATAIHDVEVERDFERIGWRIFQLYARKVYRSNDAGLILLAMDDISERKRAAEAKYRRLFETAKDGIVIIDGHTGEITDVNPYLIELFGYGRTDLIGRPFWEAEPIRDNEDARETFERIRKEDIVRLPDVSLRARDGRHIAVEVVANMYQEGLRSVAQFNIRDITERKHFDQQLQQTARLESLGILAGGIAHDFNNLLAGILGNAGLALSDAPADSPYQSALKDVVHASQRAADLTRQMLAYAGKGRFVVRQVDLAAITTEISSLIRSSIPKMVELELELPADLPLIEADAGQMQQVIMNLIINGAEAIGEGKHGRVRCSLRSEVLSTQDIRLAYPSAELRPGPHVILEVTDNGSGMDERTLNHIFDPFFTTKFTGRGLGLASVQGIIKGHHGAIHVESTLGRGSTFRVVLPSIDQAREVAAATIPLQNLRGHGELVLVVDDEDIVLRTTRAILERNGYRVLSSQDGREGVERIRERKDEIGLVILDLTMPVMGGAEALTYIREIAPSVPVIISSGYDASRASSELAGKNIAGFIQKPSPVQDFLRCVKEALRKSE
ncbi:MAG TPA: chemotaxis protein CheB [Acidisarcina sp.]